MPRLLSVNVGLPRDIAWRGETVRTAVWKHDDGILIAPALIAELAEGVLSCRQGAIQRLAFACSTHSTDISKSRVPI